MAGTKSLARPQQHTFASPKPQQKSNEWYTPAKYVEAAREVMGSIDLDPASCAMANETVKATKFYSIEDNGLEQEWGGRMWCNPPYGIIHNQSSQGIWTKRLIHEYNSGNVQEAILLVTAATDMKWFRVVWDYSICFIEHKIHFYGPQMENREHPQGACIVYFGTNEQSFIEHFSQFGTIAKRVSPAPRSLHIVPTLWEGVQ